MVKFHHTCGEINPADILSKHWGHQAIWLMLQACLFWEGGTGKLLDREALEAQRQGSVTNSVGKSEASPNPKVEKRESVESMEK